MVRFLPESSGSLYAFELSGQLTAEDVASMDPITDKYLSEHDQIRMLCVLRDFDGFTPQGDWAKTKWMFENMDRVKCLAIVGPLEDAEPLAMAGAAVGGRPVEVFGPEQTNEALQWLTTFEE